MDDVGRVYRNWNEGALYVDLFPTRYLARNPNLVRTRGAYEPCTTNTQCMSNVCHFFRAQSLQVCVTTCTPGNNATCPVDKSGVNGVCNNMGICKPAAANDCTR